MAADRSPTGWLVSALGAIVLIVSVFLPWYALGFSAHGIAFVQQLDSEDVQRFGNATLQNEIGPMHAHLNALAGQQLVTVTARQAFSTISIVLLIAGGLGVLIALLALARQGAAAFDGMAPLLAVLGAVAAACVLYRMAVRPVESPDLVLTLREGAWLSLLGSLGLVVGGLWPRRLRSPRASGAALDDAWSRLSGWTPEG